MTKLSRADLSWLLDTATVTMSRQPLLGVLELQTEHGSLELMLDEEVALAIRDDMDRFLTQ